MAPFAQAVGLKCGVDIISPTRWGGGGLAAAGLGKTHRSPIYPLRLHLSSDLRMPLPSDPSVR
jgi:hypothetical protein